MARTSSVVLLVTLLICSLVILASSGQFYASGRYGKRGELSLRSMFWSGSRYGRSNGAGGGRRQQGRSSPVEVAVRNDRFFIGSRYGKRSEEPPATTDGSVGLAEVLRPAEENGNSQVACMYTGVRNLYRCYKRKDNSSEDASNDHNSLSGRTNVPVKTRFDALHSRHLRWLILLMLRVTEDSTVLSVRHQGYKGYNEHRLSGTSTNDTRVLVMLIAATFCYYSQAKS
ncbi:hypothetical protein Cfor_02598 [Coptotermes formosanus]|uniref:Uncharacterized protein n=1 Tax=Coptotermes formosanus TaxID=36987 RepID=A0A6L2Q020_COPFO|nr:hypothetical protein Cfor_02598 [Coptotermes formosanus]